MMKCPLLPETIDGLEGALKETKLGIKGWITEGQVEEEGGLKGFLISFDTLVREVLLRIPELRGRLKEDEDRRGVNHKKDQHNCSGSKEGSPSPSSSTTLGGANDEDLDEGRDEGDIVIVKEEADIDSWIPENEDEGEQMGQEGEEDVDPLQGIADLSSIDNNPPTVSGNFILPIPTYQFPRPLPIPPPPNYYLPSTSTGSKRTQDDDGGFMMMPPDPPNYCCNQRGCGFTSKSKSGLGNHMRRKHGSELICTLCPQQGMSFSYAQSLEKHKQEVHGGNNWKKSKIIGLEEPLIYQKVLDKNKGDKGDLVEKKEKPRPYLCADCPRTFLYWNMLNTHIRLSHQGERDPQCVSQDISNGEPWKFHKGYESLEEAKSDLKSMGHYTFQSYIGSSSNWSKEFFECKESEGCGKKVYIEVQDTATEVKMFVNKKYHNHKSKWKMKKK